MSFEDTDIIETIEMMLALFFKSGMPVSVMYVLRTYVHRAIILCLPPLLSWIVNEKVCVKGESNPQLNLGRVPCYHYTINASNLQVQEPHRIA